MAYTTIDDPSAYFQSKLHTGTGSEQAVSGIGFAPNWVWIKSRSNAHDHFIHDTVRGATKRLNSLNTDAEATTAEGLKSFDSDGFTMGTNGNINEDDETFVSWNWKETADAGFDIVSYTGSGSAKTVAHNLGVKPDVIICKSRSGAEEWRPYFSALGATFGMRFNDTNAKDDDAGYWNDVEPTSSVFTVGTNAGTNGSSVTFIAYCFAKKQGYSKFGSYIGNGQADGTFIYTGFKPAWIMRKKSSGAENWTIHDNKRDTHNVTFKRLLANDSGAEYDSSSNQVDLLSNGFKCRASNDGGNADDGQYIYMAFAEQPFVTSTGVPATAR